MGDFTDQDREKLTEVHTIVKGQQTVLTDHEKRLRRAESSITKIGAFASMLAVSAGFAWDYVKEKFL